MASGPKIVGKPRTSLRQRLLQRYDDTGEWHPDLDEPDVPPAGEHLLELFGKVSGFRDYSMGGAGGLRVTEVAAYCSIQGHSLQWWEIDALMSMDAAFLAVINSSEEISETKWTPATPQNVLKLFRSIGGNKNKAKNARSSPARPRGRLTEGEGRGPKS